jgi:hypothetical protein
MQRVVAVYRPAAAAARRGNTMENSKRRMSGLVLM